MLLLCSSTGFAHVGASYDQRPFRACTLLFHEEGKAVSFEAIFAHEEDAECKIWRELLSHRTMMLLEAAWRHLFDTRAGFLVKAWDEVWRTSSKDFGGPEMEGVPGAERVPSVPGGHLGTRRRYQGDAPSMGTNAHNEDVRRRMREICRE